MPQCPDEIRRLGPARHESPLHACDARFVEDDERVLLRAETREIETDISAGRVPPSFEIAGPRQDLYFAPGDASAGIVTCGGLCPGLNDVIRGIVLSLWHHYGIRRILGYRYGYQGMSSQRTHPAQPLDPQAVESIHELGGTILGSSRGPQDIDDMIETLQRDRVDILFAIGGDGTLRGARAIDERLQERDVPITVVGVPKTIDNDIQWVTRSFGFSTAVEAAGIAIVGAHAEAWGARNGVGLVKLMGRHAGYIALHSTLAHSDVNFCLIPEFPSPLDGERGLITALDKRLQKRDHAVIVVAEGFGQDLMQDSDDPPRDPSGNLKLLDIGVFLRDRIRTRFEALGTPVDVKYIDPSYMVRSQPANALDSELCLALAQHAVHAAMSGRSGLMIGHCNGRFTHVPLRMAERRHIAPDSPGWQRVLEATGQGIHLDFPKIPTNDNP